MAKLEKSDARGPSTSDDPSAIEAKISAELSRRPECFITHPSEVGVLQKMKREEIEELAHRNGWRLVRRLGGRQYQFYNDTCERLINETESPAALQRRTP